MLAINGSVGIGTGFSTDIPPHNPKEVVGLLKARLAGAEETLAGKTLNPWWIGFRGSVEKKDEKQWITRGLYEWRDTTCSVKISELPVGTWTKDYKAFLDTMVQSDAPPEPKTVKKTSKKGGDDSGSVASEKKQKAKSILKGFEDLYNDVDVNFVLYLEPDYYKKARADPAEFEKLFHLTSSWKTTNMCCFNSDMNIVRYDTIGDILEDFYETRLKAYETRRQHQIATLNDHLEELEAKWNFIKAIVEGRLKLMNEEDETVLAGLLKLGVPPRSDRVAPDTLGAFEYLLKMRVDRMKKKSVDEAAEEVEKTNQKLEELVSTSSASIWAKELDEFVHTWEPTENHMLAVLSASTEMPVNSGTRRKIQIKKPSKK
jgi:DNA topoisomerase-2